MREFPKMLFAKCVFRINIQLSCVRPINIELHLFILFPIPYTCMCIKRKYRNSIEILARDILHKMLEKSQSIERKKKIF